MVLADKDYQAYPSFDNHWQADFGFEMDPNSHPHQQQQYQQHSNFTTSYDGSLLSTPTVGQGQVWAHEGPVSSIQGWTGQPTPVTPSRSTKSSQKRTTGDAAYILTSAPDGMVQRPARSRRPSHLTLGAAIHPNSQSSSDLPQLTSQLAIDPTPSLAESPYAPSHSSMSSTGRGARNSAGSIYGYDHASEGSSAAATNAMIMPGSRMYDQIPVPNLVPAYTYQQLVPPPSAASHPSPSPSVGAWSEASYSTSPVYTTGGTGVPVQYTQQVMVETPAGWQYQNVPVQVYALEGPPSAPIQYVMANPIGAQPLEYQPQGMVYQSAGVPPVQRHLPVAEQITSVESSLGPVRNRVRRKVAIGRVRLSTGEHATPTFATGSLNEQSWTNVAQSQTHQGAFTHSGVYGMDPSMPGHPSADQTFSPVDSFPFGVTAPMQRPASIDGYHPPETAGLYETGQVSIPATVAASHVPLPLVSQLPPPLMTGNVSTSIIGGSMMQSGTPASLCDSTFSSEDDEPSGHLSSDPNYDDYQGGDAYTRAQMGVQNGYALQVGTTQFDGFSRMPLVHNRLETEEEAEELRDVHSVYPGLETGYALSSVAGTSSTASSSGWQQADPDALGKKRIMVMGALPGQYDGIDYPRYGSKGSRSKLAIACQGCRDKKLKCSGERPTCMNCKRRGIENCEYAESIRRRGPGRKKLAAIEKKANSEARRQAKARLQQSNEAHQEDIAGQYLAIQPQTYAYQA